MTDTTSPARVPSFALLNINGGDVRTTFMQSIIAANDAFHYNRDESDPKLDGLILTHSGPYLDDGRNKCVERALAHESTCESDIFFFIDSDVEFTPDDIRKVLSHDFDKYPVVAGTYRNVFAPPVGWSPVVYTYRTFDGTEPSGAADLNPIGDDGWDLLKPVEDDDNLKLCIVVGAGFLAIKRELLVTMGQTFGTPCPWFAEPITHDKVHLGEDTGFCLRVLGLGHPIAVDPRVRLTHTKPIAIPGMENG